MSKHKIFFHVEQGHEHGYDHTRVTIFTNDHLSLDERIEGCVDNKAGYGTAEAADKMGACYSRLKGLGYEHEADRVFMSARESTFPQLAKFGVKLDNEKIDELRRART